MLQSDITSRHQCKSAYVTTDLANIFPFTSDQLELHLLVQTVSSVKAEVQTVQISAGMPEALFSEEHR